MGQEQSGDWTTMEVVCNLSPAGHWSIDLVLRDRFIQGAQRIPLASGHSAVPLGTTAEANIRAAIEAHAARCINRVVMPL
jgi:hypothetical protein